MASHSGESVALDLSLTPELISKGIVREAIRAFQDARKAAGFDVSDRIHVKWNADAESASAIEGGKNWISEEVLAIYFERDTALAISDAELGLTLSIARA